MSVLIPTKDVMKPQHLFVPYRAPDGSDALQIVHTGTIALDASSTAPRNDAVVAFVPYGDSGHGGIPTAGAIQDFNGVRATPVVTASLAGLRVIGQDGVIAFIDSSAPQLRTQPNLMGSGGPPLCLLLELRIGIAKASIFRIAYQVTITVERDPSNEHSPDILRNIPNLIPVGSPGGSMVDATHADPVL
ncbi:hypothetical protein [Kitasatospora arboriphila]|uniref:Uncharacterized protein n=2 Tax=Kitasatospora TaxID=2063 RepID=A0ABN1TTB3_9ACTN